MTSPPPTDQPPPWAPAPRREVRSRTFKIILVVWLVIIVGAAAWALAHPTATERDQTTITQARPVVDEAIARVATAVTADGAGVVAVSGFERLNDCDVNVFRSGARYRRVLIAVVPPGSETDVLDRIAAALRPGYPATVRHGESPRLIADVGTYVLLSGAASGPGELRFQADTGDCRPAGDPPVADPAAQVPAEIAPAVLARLGLAATATTTAAVPCPGGGQVGTVEVRAGAYGGDLRLALADVEGATMLVGEPSLVGYRTPIAQVTVRAQADATIVTATTVCAD
jgi:hypothetical protein